MAAAPITDAEFRKAIEFHCLSAGLTASEGEENGRKRFLLDPGGVKLCLENGDIKCNSSATRESLRMLIMEMRESAKASDHATKSVREVNVAATVRKPDLGHPMKPSNVLTPQDIINYINPRATEQEAYLFAEFCRRKGADPMTKQVYLAIFENERGERNVSFIAGKEYFTEKAEAHPQFDGMRAGIFVRPKAGGELEHREGTFYLPSEEVLLGGWAEVYRKDRKVPMKAEVSLAEYNNGRRNWGKMPATMIRKVAMVQALREAFPQNLGGMYDSAEMEQAGEIEGAQ